MSKRITKQELLYAYGLLTDIVMELRDEMQGKIVDDPIRHILELQKWFIDNIKERGE